MSIYINSFRRRLSKENTTTESSTEEEEQTNESNQNNENVIISEKGNNNDIISSISMSGPQTIPDKKIEKKMSQPKTSSDGDAPKKSSLNIYMNSFRRRFSRDKETENSSNTIVNSSEPEKKKGPSDIAPCSSSDLPVSLTNIDTIPSDVKNTNTKPTISTASMSSSSAKVNTKSSSKKNSCYVNSFRQSSLEDTDGNNKEMEVEQKNKTPGNKHKNENIEDSEVQNEEEVKENTAKEVENNIKELTTSCTEYTDLMNNIEDDLSCFLSKLDADECKKWIKMHRNPLANETEISKPSTPTAIPIGNISIPLAPAPKKKNSSDKLDLSQTHYRIVLFSWAGGNSTGYRGFSVPGCDLLTVELPARLGRLKEEPITDVRKIVIIMTEVLERLGYFRPSAPPLLVMGHSFGSVCATEFCFYLRHKGPQFINHVKGLIVSGCSPLHLRNERKYLEMAISSKGDDDLIDYLVGMGGTQKEVAANKNIMRLVLPALRADYAAVENYHYLPQDPLPFNIFALSGDQDDRIELDVIPRWEDFTNAKFNIKWYPGGHFFLKNIYGDISKDILETMII